RRKEILERLGLHFEICSPDADETCEFYHYIFTNESCAEIDRIIGITEKGKNYGGKFCRLSSPK
ncbi:MAG: hypothetical protein KH352_02855, partial [Ruminococcus sp.]|nr:hypothetical protein [Candidatus Apopatosoma intestinale]